MSLNQGSGRTRDVLHRLAPLLILAIIAGAGWILYRDLRHYTFTEIRHAVERIHPWRMWFCVCLMVVNYIVLMGYDILAVKSIGHPLPLRRIAFASFVGFAMSYNFGSLLGGGSVRYRFYSSWGLKPTEIVRLVLILGITFWFGVFGLAGVVFLWKPMEIAPELEIPVHNTNALAWALIAMAAAYLTVAAIWKKPLRIFGKEVRLPGFAMSAAQLSVAALDLIIAAACFYVLFPASVGVSYIEILGIYLLAVVAGVLTHAPGGAGVFEAVVIGIAPQEQKPAFTAACIVFRVLYNWLPLLVAGPMYGFYERKIRLRQRRAKAAEMPTKAPT